MSPLLRLMINLSVYVCVDGSMGTMCTHFQILLLKLLHVAIHFSPFSSHRLFRQNISQFRVPWATPKAVKWREKIQNTKHGDCVNVRNVWKRSKIRHKWLTTNIILSQFYSGVIASSLGCLLKRAKCRHTHTKSNKSFKHFIELFITIYSCSRIYHHHIWLSFLLADPMQHTHSEHLLFARKPLCIAERAKDMKICENVHYTWAKQGATLITSIYMWRFTPIHVVVLIVRRAHRAQQNEMSQREKWFSLSRAEVREWKERQRRSRLKTESWIFVAFNFW